MISLKVCLGGCPTLQIHIVPAGFQARFMYWWHLAALPLTHYNDVIMTAMASQITSLTVVYSTVNSDADRRKHQNSASLALVWGIHWDRWIPRTKGQLRGKCFHLMTSSWKLYAKVLQTWLLTDWKWSNRDQSETLLQKVNYHRLYNGTSQ